jgi:4-hydroxy-tetrahydrodipicolinate synthase
VNIKKLDKGDNMMLKEKIHIAVPTAFFEDESVNIQGTIDHIRDWYKQGVKSVLVSGSTGEQHSLSLKEKMEIINRLVSEEELIHNMEILFGVSSIRQKEAEELAKKIRTTKISGILLGYPPYVLPTQEDDFDRSRGSQFKDRVVGNFSRIGYIRFPLQNNNYNDCKGKQM